MRFSNQFIEQVRDSTSIVDLIGQHVQLQKAGSSFRGLCPFPGHGEKTPSFFVSDSKQLYHCFGCKKSGTVYNFLMDFQGLTFPEAVEALAQKANIALPAPQIEAEGKGQPGDSSREEKMVLLKLNRYVAALFQKNFQGKPESSQVKIYAQARGLSADILQEFKLGYTEPGWSDLVDYLNKGRAPLHLAEKLGLIKKKANGEYFDLFRDRLMFPILSTTGDVLGFGGRSLGDQQPKYLNSPETPLFHKGRTLYGLHVTAKHIRAQNEVYVVEGYMDLLALYQYGIKNVVATLGTAFTSEHARAIQKLCSKVVVLFDGDEAGQMAADKSLPIFLDAGLFPRCLTLPDEADPDDFLRKFGADQFLKRAKEAPDHFLSFLGRQMQNYGGRPTEKVDLLNTVEPILERVRDQRLRILYLQEVAERLGVTPAWLTQQLKSLRTQPVDIKQEKSYPNEIIKIPIEESILVRFMLQKTMCLERVRASGIISKFVSKEAQMTAERIIEKYCQNPNDFDKLAASLIIQDQGSFSSQLLTGHIGEMSKLDETGEMQLFNDCLARVKERDFKIKSKSILNSLKSNQESSTEKLEELMKMAQEQKGPQGGLS